MRKFIFLLLIASCYFLHAQDKTIKTSSSYVFVLTDTAHMNAAGSVGDSLSYTLAVTNFVKYQLPSVTLTRRVGDYTKANVKVYSSPNFSDWTLTQTLTFAGTGEVITTTGSLDTVYQPYIKFDINPIDSLQSLNVKLLTTIEKEE